MSVLQWFGQFADAHWFLALCVILALARIAAWPFLLLNRLIRHLNVRRAWWPPSHVDADGDHRPMEKA